MEDTGAEEAGGAGEESATAAGVKDFLNLIIDHIVVSEAHVTEIYLGSFGPFRFNAARIRRRLA